MDMLLFNLYFYRNTNIAVTVEWVDITLSPPTRVTPSCTIEEVEKQESGESFPTTVICSISNANLSGVTITVSSVYKPTRGSNIYTPFPTGLNYEWTTTFPINNNSGDNTNCSQIKKISSFLLMIMSFVL